MARQNRSNTEENTVTETAVETPVETSTETVETPAPEAKVEVDLGPFQAVVATAVGEADKSTGAVPEAQFAEVNKVYRELDGNAAKSGARKHLEDKMLESVGALDAVTARSYSDLRSNLSAAGGTKAESKPADPTAAYVQRQASLVMAQQIVSAGAPESDEDLNVKVQELVASNQELLGTYLAHEADTSEDKGDAPELNPVLRAAVKAASGKASGRSGTGGTSGGVRRDIGKHIAEAFADKAVGDFLSIAEIAKFKSTEYGDTPPSQGAISARLFPTTTLTGIEPVEAKSVDGKNPKGARKTA